jgi:hypothetical protein
MGQLKLKEKSIDGMDMGDNERIFDIKHLQAEKLTETIAFELGTLGGAFILFFLLCVCECSFVLLYASPLMRQLQNNI